MTIKSALCTRHGYSIPSSATGGRCTCKPGECPFDKEDATCRSK